MATGCDSTSSTPSVRLREASSSLLSLEENRKKRMLRRTHKISLVLSTQKGFACSSRHPHHEREVTLLIYQHLSAIIEHAPLETLAARTVLPMLSDAGRVLWSGHLRYRRAFSCSAVSNLQRTGPPVTQDQLSAKFAELAGQSIAHRASRLAGEYQCWGDCGLMLPTRP